MDNLNKDTSRMKEVSKTEFYKAIGPLVSLQVSYVDNKWPYTSVFTTGFGSLRGKIVGYLPEGSALEQKRYYLPS